MDVLCCTSGVGVRMCCVVHWVYVYVLCCTLGVGVCVVCRLYVCDVHYMYVHMVEEKALVVCRVWKPIQSTYKIRTKVKVKN